MSVYAAAWRGRLDFLSVDGKHALNVSLQVSGLRAESPHVVFMFVKLSDSSDSSPPFLKREKKKQQCIYRLSAIREMKLSVVVALVSRRMTKARFAASKAADSHQASSQPRETEADVLPARQHMLKGSQLSRARTLLSAVVELSVRPGHQAVTAPQTQQFSAAAGDLLDIFKTDQLLFLSQI